MKVFQGLLFPSLLNLPFTTHTKIVTCQKSRIFEPQIKKLSSSTEVSYVVFQLSFNGFRAVNSRGYHNKTGPDRKKTGAAERASTANQIQGFRIPDRKNASEKNKTSYVAVMLSQTVVWSLCKFLGEFSQKHITDTRDK